jgi:hypothetical protein
MRTPVIIIAFLTLVLPVSAGAVAGVGIGAKVGFATYKGDVLPTSGDVGKDVYYGVILDIGALPIVDLELHLNYYTTPFNYTYRVGGQQITTAFDFRDISAIGILKKNLIAIPTSPLGLYVGGGFGYHVMSTEIILATAVDPLLADDPIGLLENTGKISANGMVGLKLAPMMVPFAVYGEGRFGQIFASEKITTFSIEAGLMVKF